MRMPGRGWLGFRSNLKLQLQDANKKAERISGYERITREGGFSLSCIVTF